MVDIRYRSDPVMLVRVGQLQQRVGVLLLDGRPLLHVRPDDERQLQLAVEKY